MKHPPDAARKNQLFSGRNEAEEEEEEGHQFFFTTGWIERFAQLIVYGDADAIPCKY